MKLKKRTGTSSNLPFDGDERFHCCRYCHYYDSGYCYNKSVAGNFDGTANVVDVAESGRLSGVLEETMHSCDTKEMLNELKDLLKSWKIGDKRVKEFEKTFSEVFNQWLDFTLKDELDMSVSNLYERAVDTGSSSVCVEIENPTEYYCKEFM